MIEKQSIDANSDEYDWGFGKSIDIKEMEDYDICWAFILDYIQEHNPRIDISSMKILQTREQLVAGDLYSVVFSAKEAG